MRITILSNQDLASCIALNYLLPGLQQHQLSVFLSSRVGGSGSQKNRQPQALLDLKFYEQELFLKTVFPIADALSLESPVFRTFKSLAEKYRIPISDLNRINDEEFDLYAATKPDLVLSIRYGVILKEKAIGVPARGVLNLHSGHLPEYKGVMATFRALLNGDSKVGTTLHFIDDSSIDTGPIIDKSSFPVNSNKSYLWHVLALYEDACAMILQAVGRIEQGEDIESSSQHATGDYYSFPAQEDLDEFASQGWSLIQPDELMEIIKKFYRSNS